MVFTDETMHWHFAHTDETLNKQVNRKRSLGWRQLTLVMSPEAFDEPYMLINLKKELISVVQ